MPITMMGLLEDVEKFEGKNGFGATVTVSEKVGRKTKRLSFMIKDKNLAERLENDYLDKRVQLKIELNENKFGMRFGDIIELDEVA